MLRTYPELINLESLGMEVAHHYFLKPPHSSIVPKLKSKSYIDSAS